MAAVRCGIRSLHLRGVGINLPRSDLGYGFAVIARSEAEADCSEGK